MTEQPKSPFAKLRSRFFHLYFVATRPMTLGVRAAVFDSCGRVFLVRHTYTPGWHFPGGGVESGETALDALRRELFEEGAIAIEEEPRLHGLFFNRAASRRDHVALYIVRRFRQDAPPAPNWEIAETGFFAPDALPEATSRGTRARLKEIFETAPAARLW